MQERIPIGIPRPMSGHEALDADRWMHRAKSAEPSGGAGRVADEIVKAVARGRLVSQEQLVEAVLAERLGVSRVPLREALRILESQGLLVPGPRRGVQFITFDRDWALQLHDVRVNLEKLASRAAAAHVRRDHEAAALLDCALRAIQDACRTAESIAIHEADVAMHYVIYDLSGSPLLMTLWRAMARHVTILFSLEHRRVDPMRIVDEHTRLRDVLMKGTDTEIDAAVELHVAGLKYAHDREGGPVHD